MLVHDAINDWVRDALRAAKVGNLSPVTVENYQRDLLVFEQLVGDVDLADLSADRLNDVFDAFQQLPDARYVDNARKSTKSRRTLQRFYYSLSRFFNDAVRRGWVDRSPVPDTYMARGKTNVTEDPKRKSVGVDGANRLLSAPLANRDVFILRVLIEAGPRVGELCAADRSDLVHDEMSACYWLDLKHTKNNVARRVPISYQTITFYQAYVREDIVPAQARPNKPHTLADSERALLRSSRGRRLMPRDVQNLLQRTGRKVGVDVTPHGLRHTAATVLLESGTDIHVVRDLLGHSSTTVTSQYLDANAMDVSAAVNSHPINRRA